MGMFDEDGVTYGYGEWSAQDDRAAQNAAVKALIAEGSSANMVRFKEGAVLAGRFGMEHMASFDYAYKLSAVRDWLFEQRR